MTSRVAVIGAGVAGLATAYELGARGLAVSCLEGGSRAGGNIRTDRVGGFLCEAGPTGFLDNVPATLDLVRRLGLGDRVVQASEAAARRYIFRKGRLREVPLGPGAFLGSGILSARGKLRLLGEPLMPRSREEDESVFDFAARRIGREAAEVLVDAMVSGVYAGDARRLSLAAAFPKMRAMEAEHGSLFRALIAKRRAARGTGAPAGGGPAGPGGRLTSFRGGLQELTDALAAALGDRLELGNPVRSVVALGRRGFRILRESGAPIEADAVVLAVPAWHAAPLVEGLDAELARLVAEIPSAPVIVVHTAFRTLGLGDQPLGFGYLVPRGQGLRTLGTLWITQIFPGRAPDGATLLTTMAGGAHDPAAIELDDAAVLRIVLADLQAAMGITVRPYLTRIVRWPRGIPQYPVGHVGRLAAIDERLAAFPDLRLMGNSYRGISVNACVEEAPRVAEAIAAELAAR